jgi:uncharacterized pyridoxamine 5'-phosphate oxidase family protein
MNNQPKLKDIVDALQIQPLEAHFYLDKESGEIVMISDEEIDTLHLKN